MWNRSAALAAVFLAFVPMCVWVTAVADAAPVVTPGCTNVPPSGNPHLDSALTPAEVADRYGITPFHAAGFTGAGLDVVALELDASVDPDLLATWQQCLDLPSVPVDQNVVGGGVLPGPGDEPQADAQVLSGLLPGIESIHILVLPVGLGFGPAFVQTLQALQAGTYTGGHAPDVVSMSIGACESTWAQHDIDQSEALLQALASDGTWFVKSAGDAGSSDCASHGDCSAVTDPEKVLATEYPTTSSWMTAVGGSQFVGASPTGDAVVWDDPSKCSAGGGGTSQRIAQPIWQHDLFSGQSTTNRMVPDITALAGSPFYLTLQPHASGHPVRWEGDGGTSLATPTYAAGLALMGQAMTARGIAVPALLDPEIYRIAADPQTRALVFIDVISGNDDLFGLGCCTATTGFDLASGYGEMNVAALYEILAPPDPVAPSVPVRPVFTG
jgi:subtilase family serine protease